MATDDDNCFRYFAPEPPARIPEGWSAPLDMRTATEMMAERKAWLENSVQCPTCAGQGRVSKS